MSDDSYIEEFIRSDYYNKMIYGKENKPSSESYEKDRKIAREILDYNKKNQELIELEKQKFRENCNDDEKYPVTTNILVLCQREKGNIFYTEFTYGHIYDIVYRPISMFLKSEEKCNLNIEYMTSINDVHKDDKMTYNLFFNYNEYNEPFIEFLKDHIGYYSYIIFGACPLDIFETNIQNIIALSKLLRDDGKIFFPLLDDKFYNSHAKFFYNFYQTDFKYITNDPFIIIQKNDTYYSMRPRKNKSRKSDVRKRKSRKNKSKVRKSESRKNKSKVRKRKSRKSKVRKSKGKVYRFLK